jgi:predicted ATP-dependent protease
MGNRTRKHGDNEQMSSVADVARARDYIAAIGGPGKGATIIGKAYEKLAELFPHENDPRDRWTLRRVRSFWERDAAHVKFREMIEMHRAAEIAKSERELIAQARKDHAAFIAKTTAIRAFLEHQDEDFSRSSVAGLGRVSGDLDSARDRTDRP